MEFFHWNQLLINADRKNVSAHLSKAISKKNSKIVFHTVNDSNVQLLVVQLELLFNIRKIVVFTKWTVTSNYIRRAVTWVARRIGIIMEVPSMKQKDDEHQMQSENRFI